MAFCVSPAGSTASFLLCALHPSQSVGAVGLEADWNAFQLPSLLVGVVQMCSSARVQSRQTCQPTPRHQCLREESLQETVLVWGCCGPSHPTTSDYGFLRPNFLCNHSPDGTADHLQLVAKNEDVKGKWMPLDSRSLTQILLQLFLDEFASVAFCQGHRVRRWTLARMTWQYLPGDPGEGICQESASQNSKLGQ